MPRSRRTPRRWPGWPADRWIGDRQQHQRAGRLDQCHDRVDGAEAIVSSAASHLPVDRRPDTAWVTVKRVRKEADNTPDPDLTTPSIDPYADGPQEAPAHLVGRGVTAMETGEHSAVRRLAFSNSESHWARIGASALAPNESVARFVQQAALKEADDVCGCEVDVTRMPVDQFEGLLAALDRPAEPIPEISQLVARSQRPGLLSKLMGLASVELSDHHDLDPFESDRTELLQWLKLQARRAQHTGTARVTVWTDESTGAVVGYSTVALTHVAPDELSRMARAGPSASIPAPTRDTCTETACDKQWTARPIAAWRMGDCCGSSQRRRRASRRRRDRRESPWPPCARRVHADHRRGPVVPESYPVAGDGRGQRNGQ